MVPLKNKTIILTGASSGLGEALAYQLAKENCNLVLAARRIKKLKAIKKELGKKHKKTKVLLVKTDISKEKDVKTLFKKAKKEFGKIDILINNAGRGLNSEIQKISKKEWDSVIGTNLTGVFLCSKEAIKDMLKKNTKGHIITIGSIAGIYGAPKYSAYCASKHGVAGLKRSLMLEVWKKGIKISTLYPARINTEFFKEYTKKPTSKQMLNPKDVAEYIVIIAKRSKTKLILKKLSLIFKRAYNLLLK